MRKILQQQLTDSEIDNQLKKVMTEEVLLQLSAKKVHNTVSKQWTIQQSTVFEQGAQSSL